jgi:hypothetical protein
MALEEEYIHFWGMSGYEEMKIKWRLIDEEIESIGTLLYSGWTHHSFTNSCGGRAAWQQRAMQLQQLRKAEKKFMPNLNWLRKVCFASYKGANLEERMKRLKDKVQFSPPQTVCGQADQIPGPTSSVLQSMQSRLVFSAQCA